MTFNLWYLAAYRSWAEDNRGQRQGQYLVNDFFSLDPSQAQLIPRDVDPFYDDKRIPLFLAWLAEIWDG
jgi:hypothetical protein